jgi:hypothetical protein
VYPHNKSKMIDRILDSAIEIIGFVWLVGVIALIVAIFVAGCRVCDNNQQRCHDGVAQLCDTAGKWRPVLRCAELRQGWDCYCLDGRCGCRGQK